jgi:hypothetical protein
LGVGVSELEFQMCKKDQVHQPSLPCGKLT